MTSHLNLSGYRGRHAQNKKNQILILCLCILLMACFKSEPTGSIKEEFKANVVKIPEGDVLHLTKSSTSLIVNLWGVDTPKPGQAFDNVSRNFSSKHALNKEVTVQLVKADHISDSVTYIILPNGKNLNHAI